MRFNNMHRQFIETKSKIKNQNKSQDTISFHLNVSDVFSAMSFISL